MRRENIYNILNVSIYALAVLILAGVFLMPKFSSAQIIINEINWNGTDISSSDEWIELYNTSTSTIDLTNYTLSWNTTDLSLDNLQIDAKDFLLLERTDNDTVPEITADMIYTGSLRNSGENLILQFDNQIIDQADFSTGWPDTNNIDFTLQRDCNDFNIWQNATSSPRAINTICESGIEESDSETDNDDNNITTSTKLFSVTGKACTLTDAWNCQDETADIFTNFINSSLNDKLEFTSSTNNNIDILQTSYNNINIKIFIFYLTKKIFALGGGWLFFGNF